MNTDAADHRGEATTEIVTPRGLSRAAAVVVEEVAAYFHACGYRPEELVSVNWKSTRGMEFVFVPVSQAPEVILQHPDTDVYISGGVWRHVPARGRGVAEDIARIPALWADLDLKEGGFESYREMHAVIREISEIIGAPPVVELATGGGIQPRWVLDGDIDAATLAGFGLLVEKACRQHGCRRDSVYDLPRILRAPGSVNHKRTGDGSYRYGDGPTPTRLRLREGAPVDVDRLRRVLDEQGIQLDSKTQRPRAQSSELQPPMAPSAELAPGRNNRYAQAALEGVLNDLKASALWPEGSTDERGRGWEKLQADCAWRLAGLALADWNDITVDQARQAFLSAAPTGGGWTLADAETKWNHQLRYAVPADHPADRVLPSCDLSGLLPDPTKPTAMSPTTAADLDELTERRRTVLTDADQAAVVATEVLAGRWVWTKELGWLRFDGRRWKPQPMETVRLEVMQYYRRAVDTQHREIVNKAGGWSNLTREQEKYLAALKGLLSKSTLDAVTALASALVQVEASIFDAYPDLLNVANGVLDLRTGQLRPHDPALYMTKIADVAYRPEALTDPDLTSILDCIPDPEVRSWLQVRVGQAITGYVPPDDLLLVLHGGGSNGKSTLMGAFQHCLGEYAVTVSDKVLLDDSMSHSTERMQLWGARFGLIEEVPGGHELNMNKLKKILGTPKIEARRMRMDPIEWSPTHTLFMTSNAQPVVRATDHGAWRRLAKVSFPIRYRGAHEAIETPFDRRGDSRLRARVEANDPALMESFLAWLVEGARRWYVNDRVMPEVPCQVVQDTQVWRMETDLILGFLTECLTFQPDSHVLAADLYDEFSRWMEANGMHPWSKKIFKTRFMEHSEVQGGKVTTGKTRNQTNVSRPTRMQHMILPTGVQHVVNGLAFGRDNDPGLRVVPSDPMQISMTALIGDDVKDLP